MDSWILFILGAVSALAGIYFREALRHAYRQKMLAAKLEAQLNLLEEQLIDRKFAPYFAAADKWNDARISAYESSGHPGYIEVDERYQRKVAGIKEQILAGEPEVDTELKKNWRLYSEMPDSLFTYSKQQFEIVRDSILSGAMLMDDNEGAELSWVASAGLTKLRSLSIELIHRNITFLLMCRELPETETEALRELTAEHTEKIILLARELRPLRKFATSIRRKNAVRLAFKGIIKST